jgi:hypothetical protein
VTAAPSPAANPATLPPGHADSSAGVTLGSTTRLAAAALVSVVVLALTLRLWGIGWQLPWQFHPDEGHYTWKAMDLISQETLNPKYFRNPSLFTYILPSTSCSGSCRRAWTPTLPPWTACSAHRPA